MWKRKVDATVEEATEGELAHDNDQSRRGKATGN